MSRPRTLRAWFYLAHRWIGLVISVQLLAWSVGGFAFSLLSLDDVRGERERLREPRPILRATDIVIEAREALARGAQCGGEAARAVLQVRLGHAVYDLYDAKDKPLCAVDAASGAVRKEITEDEAVALAKLDFSPTAAVASVRRIDRDPPLEYRGKPLPVFQVTFNHTKAPHIYVAASTGEITARRNARWRLHDFFWMLHVMDYRERESYNHALITAASALAIATALTGLILQVFRLGNRQARRSSPSTGADSS